MEQISSAEWKIMRVIWSNQPVYTKNIIEILQHTQKWSASTIKTLLARLVNKKVVEIITTTGKFQYIATIDKTQYVEEEMQHLLSKVCNQTKMKVLIDIIKNIEISKKDLQTLELLIHTKTPIDTIQCECPRGLCNNEKI